jgi:hypothetical protein
MEKEKHCFYHSFANKNEINKNIYFILQSFAVDEEVIRFEYMTSIGGTNGSGNGVSIES